MASTFTSTTLSGSYDDDFDEGKNFHQILFNSGRALQARELTQLQTLIYKEMGRLGRNIFKEGAAVSNGGSAINAEYEYVKIATVNAGTFSEIPVGTVFTQVGSSISARVLEVKSSGGDFTSNTLYVKYTNSGSSTAGTTPPRFSVSGNIVGGGYDLTIGSSATDLGRGVRVDVADGDFFVLGRFVHFNGGSLILSPYSQVANAEIGFKVTQEVINVNDDNTLYDNAGGLVNTASPGADRYRIRLTLIDKDDITATDTFVYVARIENSKIVDEAKATDGYNEINNLLALRTKEESGDYIVNPFTINFDSASSTHLSLTVSPGVAYVNGYRVENKSPLELIVPRSQGDGETVNNDVVPVVFGNYFKASALNTLSRLSTYDSVTIYNGDNTAIGSTRVRSVERSGSLYNVYVFDTNMYSGKGFDSASKIGTATNYYTVDNPDNKSAVLLGTLDNDLLMPTPRPRPASFTDIVVTTQRHVDKASEASGSVINMPTLSGDEKYANGANWFIRRNDSADTVIVPTVTIAANGYDATITNVAPAVCNSVTYRIVYEHQDLSAAHRTKTLDSANGSFSVVNGYVDLDVPDVTEVKTIRQVHTDGNARFDVSERFTLDDGQRDNYYANSRLVLNPGATSPGTVFVEYKKFTRGGSGNFYTPESYTSTPYSQIPDHIRQDGTRISLRNYLDFRPDKDSDGSGNATWPTIHYLPKNGTSVLADVTYHLPRADKLIATPEGEIQLLMGQQSRDPQLKKTPENSLELYQILMNANTANEEDVQIVPIEHKRYTMADIARLDDKLEDLKEYTEMNIAELRAYHTPSLDSDGNERPTSGLVVDEAKDQTGAATEDPNYNASIDPENGIIRPGIDEDNVRLIKTTGYGTTNIQHKGDNIYIDYDSATWKDQPLASRSVKVNPFGMVDNVGVIKLSPSSDEWKESKEEAVKAIAGGTRLATNQAFLWNNWQWNWKGRNNADLWLGDLSRAEMSAIRQRVERFEPDIYSSSRGSRGLVGYVNRVVKRDTLRQVIGNRIIDLALIPWIRSRKIYFKAQGLTPNTKFTPFFDGTNVASWCREEASFVQFSQRTDDLGNIKDYSSLSAHPDGTTDLISDANGEIIGSFWIPNLKPTYYVVKKWHKRRLKQTYLRFRAGVREFKLLDITENDWARSNSKAFAYYTVQGSLWHRWNNILSTRPWQSRWPITANFAGFPAAFSPQELKSTLDAVTTANVGIFEPQKAGQYAPNTSFLNTAALNALDASGQMAQVLSDYVGVDNKQFASGVAAPVSLPQNPLSQTFYVDNQFGVTLQKIALFFKEKDTTLPISIHLRPVVDGKPSSTDIVPDSHVFLNPGSVSVVGGTPTLTTIAASPTVFEFTEPVYLQPWTHYAIVISSQSEKYELWSAKTLDNVIGNPSRTITTQPAPGSLFLPQNGVNWLESKDQDLMMKLTRCVFDVGGATLVLENAPISYKLLQENPLRFTAGSSTVYVHAPCNGFAAGDSATLSGVSDIIGRTTNLVANTSLNGGHIVDSADIHGYTFSMSSGTSDSDMTAGGSTVITSRNMVFDVCDPNIETIIPNGTSIDVSAKFTTGCYPSADQSLRFRPNGVAQDMINAKFEKITPDTNIEFDAPRAIYFDGFTDGTSGLGSGTAGKTKSTYFKVDMKTSNDYVSPIVDLQRASLTLVGSCIDDPSAVTPVYNVAETAANGGTTGSKHITAPYTLEVPSSGFDIRYRGSIPTDGNIDTYYRVAQSDENINEVGWTLQPNEGSVANTAKGQYTDVQVLPGGVGGTLPQFTQAQVKFVFRGKNESPTMKDLSIRFLAL